MRRADRPPAWFSILWFGAPVLGGVIAFAVLILISEDGKLIAFGTGNGVVAGILFLRGLTYILQKYFGYDDRMRPRLKA